jgi:biopolymer transport protein ExbD
MSSLADANKCEPNLVPMLDMVFQLITFFMLVVNFKAQSVDRELMLPVIGSTRPVEEEDESRLLVLNVRPNGDVAVRGQVQPAFPLYIRVEAETLRTANNLKKGDALPMRIVVRGDRTLTVGKLMGVVDLCREQGFDRFDFVATQTAKK